MRIEIIVNERNISESGKCNVYTLHFNDENKSYIVADSVIILFRM